MANVITLQEVTVELKQSNATLERIEDHSQLTNEFLNLSVDTFKQGFSDLLSFFKGNSLADLERQREQDEFNRDMLAALEDLKPKYTGPEKAATPKDSDFGLGGLLTGLAFAIGSVIGVIKGQITAIRAFAKALTPNALLEKLKKGLSTIIDDIGRTIKKIFSPSTWMEKIRKPLASFIAGLSMEFDLLKASMKEKFLNVGKFLTGVFDDIVKFFAGADDTKGVGAIKSGFARIVDAIKLEFDLIKMAMSDKLGSVGRFLTGVFDDIVKLFSGESKLFSGLKNSFNALITPFVDLFNVVRDASSGPFSKIGEWFKGIASTFDNFGAMIGKVAGIVGKIFAPIAIIMTVYDTVKGFIEGFEKDGIIGGIAGGVKGFFNSLIFAPLDMLKDATGWILGFFGFDKAKEFIQSFSFEKMFSDVIDAVFSPIETVKKLMDGVVSFFSDIGAKLTGFMVDFEIPGFSIFGKQFGPWKPFSGMKKVEAPAAAPPRDVQRPQIATPTAPQTADTPSSRMAAAGQGTAARVPPLVLGSGDAADIVNVDGKQVIYRYSPSQPYVWTPDEIKEKARALERGEQIDLGTAFIPKDESHRNPLLRRPQIAEAPSTPTAPTLSLPTLSPEANAAAIAAANAPGMAVQSGQQLQTAAQENGALAAAPARPAAGPGGVQQNNSTTVINNSTTVVKPIPAATRRPNNAEDTFFNIPAYYGP